MDSSFKNNDNKKYPRNVSNENKITVCRNCNEICHIARRCKEPLKNEITCYICNNPGYIATNCKDNKKKKSTIEMEENEIFNNLEARPMKTKFNRTILVGNCPYNA